MERYEKVVAPGRWDYFGKFSKLFTARDKTSGKEVIIKRHRWESHDEEAMIWQEVRILQLLSNHDDDKIVKLRDHVDDRPRRAIFLVFEKLHMDMGRVIERVRGANSGETARDDDDGPLSPRRVRCYIRQALRGLAHCHENKILHRDLRPAHLLLSPDGTLKLAGFGRARSLLDGRGPLTHEVATLWYRPPEILLGCEGYGPAVDVWSLGCTFAQMVTARPLFPGRCEIDQLYRIFRQLGTPSERVWPGVTGLRDWNAEFPRWHRSDFHENMVRNVDPLGHELLELCLMYNPSDRISAKHALDHPYFSCD